MILGKDVDPIVADCGDVDTGLTVAVADGVDPAVGMEGVGVSGVIGISDMVGVTVNGFSDIVGDDVTDDEGPDEGVEGDSVWEPDLGVVGEPCVFGDIEEPNTVEPDMGVLAVPKETVDCIPGLDVVNMGRTVEPRVTVLGFGVMGAIVDPGYR